MRGSQGELTCLKSEIAQLRARLDKASLWGSAEQMAAAERLLMRQESWAKFKGQVALK